METQTHRFTWKGIEIEAVYEPLKWKTIAHPEIRRIAPENAPLLITETGYRSHSDQPGTVEALGGGVVAQVIGWLNEEAAKPHWKRHVEASRQGCLF